MRFKILAVLMVVVSGFGFGLVSCSCSSEERTNYIPAKHYWTTTFVKKFSELQGPAGSHCVASWKFPMGGSNQVKCTFTVKDNQIDSFSMTINGKAVEDATCRIENERFIGGRKGVGEDEFSFEFEIQRYDISGKMNYDNNDSRKILVEIVRLDPADE